MLALILRQRPGERLLAVADFGGLPAGLRYKVFPAVAAAMGGPESHVRQQLSSFADLSWDAGRVKSASIAQVHLAEWRGKPAVAKVLHQCGVSKLWI